VKRDVFVPVGQWTDPSFLDRRVDVSSHAVGRLRPGVKQPATEFLLQQGAPCAKVASLLLARSMRRPGEFALRVAIGARRRRIVMQLLTESLMIAGLGGVTGILLAIFSRRTILRMLPAALPRSADIAIDARVLLFTLGVSLLGGIGFGHAPAFKSSKVNLQQVLRRSSHGAGGGRHRLQGSMVAFQLAIALVRLAGAGLMLRSGK
jgi:putative ABC transport system permease protein